MHFEFICTIFRALTRVECEIDTFYTGIENECVCFQSLIESNAISGRWGSHSLPNKTNYYDSLSGQTFILFDHVLTHGLMKVFSSLFTMKVTSIPIQSQIPSPNRMKFIFCVDLWPQQTDHNIDCSFDLSIVFVTRLSGEPAACLAQNAIEFYLIANHPISIEFLVQPSALHWFSEWYDFHSAIECIPFLIELRPNTLNRRLSGYASGIFRIERNGMEAEYTKIE